jgi:hypothetical protein
MNFQDTQIGQSVVRSKGDYVVGRTGEIVKRDEQKNRVRVLWSNGPKTWVSCKAIELTFIPYEIIPGTYNPETGKRVYPKYRKK